MIIEKRKTTLNQVIGKTELIRAEISSRREMRNLESLHDKKNSNELTRISNKIHSVDSSVKQTRKSTSNHHIK